MFTMMPAAVKAAGGGASYKPHRYWRIRFTANQGSIYFLAQGQSGFSLTPGGAFVAPTSVGATSEDFEPATGFFQASARWSTNWGSGQTITADFGTPQAFAQLRMLGNASFPDRTGKDFAIDWSDNGTTWTQSASFTGQDLTTNTYKSYVVGDPA